MTPIEPAGLRAIAENEVLRLPDGELTARINAVYDPDSPDREFSSLHTIVGGTGRYAVGRIHLRGP